MIPAGGIQLTLVMLDWPSWAVEWEGVGMKMTGEGPLSAHITTPHPLSAPPPLRAMPVWWPGKGAPGQNVLSKERLKVEVG